MGDGLLAFPIGLGDLKLLIHWDYLYMYINGTIGTWRNRRRGLWKVFFFLFFFAAIASQHCYVSPGPTF